MSKKPVRTVAFQIDDWDFLKEYDQRQQDSGLSVKNYFISLIKADIAMNQMQKDNLTHEVSDQADAGAEQAAEMESRQKEENPAPGQNEPSENADVTEESDITDDQEQTDDPAPQPEQADAPGQDEKMMNLFVLITKDQRDALEAHKLKTGETVNNVVNRIIDGFLDNTDSLPEGFNEAYKHYSENIKSCDTTCSAKIPSRLNEELTEYLNSFGGSRNALMASLVELELRDQEMAEDIDEESGIQMS